MGKAGQAIKAECAAALADHQSFASWESGTPENLMKARESFPEKHTHTRAYVCVLVNSI